MRFPSPASSPSSSFIPGLHALVLATLFAPLVAAPACAPASTGGGTGGSQGSSGGAPGSGGTVGTGSGGQTGSGGSSATGSGGAVGTGGSTTTGSGGTTSGSGGASSGSGGSGAGTGGASSGTGGASSGTGGASSGSGGASSGSGGAGGRVGTGGGSGTGSGGTGSGTGGGTASGPCGNPGELFCDDFESGTAGQLPGGKWTLGKNGDGTATVDATTPAHSGTKSVKVTNGTGYQAFLELKGAPLPTADGKVYLRVYMRLGAPMTGGHNTYFKAGTADMLSSEHETRVGVMNEMLMINQPAGDRGQLSNPTYYNDGNKPGVVFQPMTWVCVEAFFDPPHSVIDMWVDGVEVPALHITDWQQDPIGALRFGFEKYAGPDATFWYDDIAVGSQRQPCN